MIIALIGAQGAGKTYSAVRAMWLLRKRHPERRIIANFPIYLPGRPVEVVDSWEELYTPDVVECDIVLDELHLWLSARDWQKHKAQTEEWFSQLRKRKILLWYTSQRGASVDTLVRGRTDYSYYFESFRRLGFFLWQSYRGMNPVDKMKDLSGWYFFSLKIAGLYDTEYLVRHL